MASHSAFDGQVTFECGYNNLEAVILRERFQEAVPEHATFKPGSQLEIVWRNLLAFFPVSTITFHLEDNPTLMLARLRDWWDEAQVSTNYRGIWEQYLKAASADFSNAWGVAYDKGQNQRLYAPPELQVEPEVAETDPSSEAATSVE